jgi:hypothetical protein
MQLHHSMAPLGFDAAGHALEALKVQVIVCAQLTREANTPMLYRCSAGHGESKSPLCATRQPVILIVTHDSVRTALQIGKRGQHETIFNG